MPWSDLSDVTGALIRLLELNIAHMLSPGSDVAVVPTPPDRLGSDVSSTLSLYLYQVRPSPAFRNLPPSATSAPATAPIALDLFYMLTAHQRSANTFDALTEQRLIGYALRTFHDYPVIVDDTRIAAELVLAGGQRGRGNPLKIERDSEEPESSVRSVDWPFPRLAIYYRVRSVLLDH